MIRFKCDCGKKFRVKDSGAGKKFDCRECRRSLRVPSVAPPPPVGHTIMPPPIPVRTQPTQNRTVLGRIEAPPVIIEDDPRYQQPEEPAVIWPMIRRTLGVLVSLLMSVLITVIGYYIVRSLNEKKVVLPDAVAKLLNHGVMLTREEEIAKNHIMKTADDPSSVQFDRWGPHYLSNPKRVIIRVVIRSNKNGRLKIRDLLVIIEEEKNSVQSGDNIWGDDWLEAAAPLLKVGDIMRAIQETRNQDQSKP